VLEVIKQVDYFHVAVADRPGEGARLLATFERAGINFLAFSGFPRGLHAAQFDFVPEDTDAFIKAAKAARVVLSEKKTAFLIQGSDSPGRVAEMASKLAEAEINVIAAQVLCAGGGRYGGIVWVAQADVAEAAKALASSSSDQVDLASDDSFPASDAPPWTP